MSDISGIYRIGPSYPVKPVQPANKDRQTDKRKKKQEDRPENDNRDDDNRDDDKHKPTIDEHV